MMLKHVTHIFFRSIEVHVGFYRAEEACCDGDVNLINKLFGD